MAQKFSSIFLGICLVVLIFPEYLAKPQATLFQGINPGNINAANNAGGSNDGDSKPFKVQLNPSKTKLPNDLRPAPGSKFLFGTVHLTNSSGIGQVSSQTFDGTLLSGIMDTKKKGLSTESPNEEEEEGEESGDGSSSSTPAVKK